MSADLSKIIDFQILRELMESLWKASGIPVGFFDLQGRMLVSAGVQDLCTLFQGDHPSVALLCTEKDTTSRPFPTTSPLLEQQEIIEHRCRHGLVDISFPLIIDDRHLANLIFGKFFYEMPDEAFLRREARCLCLDEQDYVRAMSKIPVFSQDRIEEILEFHIRLVNLLMEIGIKTERQRQSEKALHNSEQKFRQLFENSGDIIFINDLKGRILEINQTGSEKLGYSRNELLKMETRNLFVHKKKNKTFWNQDQIRQRSCGIFESNLARRDGSLIQVEINSRKIDYENQKAILNIARDVTSRKQAEASQRLAQYCVDHIADAIYLVDMTGKFLYANQAACQALGYSLEDFLTMEVHDIAPDFPPGLGSELWGEIKKRGKLVFESRHRTRDGREFPVEISSSYLCHEERQLIYSYVRDISDRVNSQKALLQALADAEESRDNIDAILYSVVDGLIVVNMDHLLVRINRAAEVLLGVKSSQVLGKRIEDLLPVDSLIEHLEAFDQGLFETATVELEIVDSETRVKRNIQSRLSVMQNRDGSKTGLIILLHDITDERELDRMKDEFISTAAHELRTPLTAVMGFAELLLQKDAVPPAQQEECLSHIHRNAEILQRIIDNLFVLSQFQKRETVPMAAEPFDLTTKLEELIEYYQVNSPKHRFHLSLPPVVPLVFIDWDKVAQVLANLLSNAVKFSSDGTITIEGGVEQDFFRLTVSDQGIGMTKDQLAKIFDKFYRVDASNTAAPGLGLGMALAKNIIEAHGGTMQATSRPGKGTSVSFTLPLSSSDSRDS